MEEAVLKRRSQVGPSDCQLDLAPMKSPRVYLGEINHIF